MPAVGTVWVMVLVALTAHTVSHKPPQSALRHKSETEPEGAASSPRTASHQEVGSDGAHTRWCSLHKPLVLWPCRDQDPKPCPMRTQQGPKQDDMLVSDSGGEPGAQCTHPLAKAPGRRLLTGPRGPHTQALTLLQLSAGMCAPLGGACLPRGLQPFPTNSDSCEPRVRPPTLVRCSVSGRFIQGKAEETPAGRKETAPGRAELGAGDWVWEKEKKVPNLLRRQADLTGPLKALPLLQLQPVNPTEPAIPPHLSHFN